MTYKESTKAGYEATAREFTDNVAELAPRESIDRFIKLLPANAKIIDIGCGSGRDAEIFTGRGLSVVGIDNCNNLMEIAKAEAPLAQFQLMDIESMKFPANSFDGAWAVCSLSHIPKKLMPNVLKQIHSFLKPKGAFYIALRKGTGESLEKDTRYKGDIQKFWSYYEEEEINKLLKDANFKVIECTPIEKQFAYPTLPCLRIFCQKA